MKLLSHFPSLGWCCFLLTPLCDVVVSKKDLWNDIPLHKLNQIESNPINLISHSLQGSFSLPSFSSTVFLLLLLLRMMLFLPFSLWKDTAFIPLPGTNTALRSRHLIYCFALHFFHRLFMIMFFFCPVTTIFRISARTDTYWRSLSKNRYTNAVDISLQTARNSDIVNKT